MILELMCRQAQVDTAVVFQGGCGWDAQDPGTNSHRVWSGANVQ